MQALPLFSTIGELGRTSRKMGGLGVLAAAMSLGGAHLPSWAGGPQSESFKKYGQEFRGKIGRIYNESQEWWPAATKPPAGTPNVLTIMLDDVGYGQLGSYGGLIETPNLDRLAMNGLRFNNFQTTAVSSPSRAALLTGRNPHRVGLGGHSLVAMGFPGYNAFIPPSAKSMAKHLQKAGFANYAVGKWDHTPLTEVSATGPFDHWPSGEGFDHFYGFMGADADHYRSLLYRDHSPIEDWQDKSGYHLSEALADEAIRNITSHVSSSPDRPFMMTWAPGALHAPHQVAPEYIKRYNGKFDMGWDKAREIVWQRQLETGVIPPGTKLAERAKEIPAWDALKPEEKRLYVRQMEVAAAMLTHLDEQVGRIITTLERTGQLDNTLVIVASDNGASAEGGLNGSFNENYGSNGLQASLDLNMKQYESWGGPTTYSHYSAGWALAGNAPFQYFKQIVHNGGISAPLIMHWPKGIKAKGEVRSQYHHIIDIAPTILEVTGTRFLPELDGVKQIPMDGVSMAYAFNDAKAPDRRTEQYYEQVGSRAIYQDGWKAVTIHGKRMPWNMNVRIPFDNDEWELYHVAEDFSESTNLAAQHPEKLDALKKRWDTLAWENNVYPLNDDIIGRLARQQDRMYGDRKEFVYFWPGAQRIPEVASAPIKNRSHSIETRLQLSGKEEGVIVACGGFTGGYTMFIKDNRLYYGYNFLGAEYYQMESPSLPTGEVDVKFSFIRSGPRKGKGELYVNGKKVAEVDMPHVAVSIFSLTESFDVGVDLGTPVSDKYRVKNHYPYTGKLDKVVVRLLDDAPEKRAALESARQLSQVAD